MVEKPQDELEAQKRRSTRIVQAVPITVIGVDALGQPFREHTSTLIINCHGCKYQSKHYVLKNTQVTIEVAHPEGGPPRQVRARILWIQRPRTVQELFQVGAEMDVAGNIWGIAFPPEDWAPAPDSGAPSIPAPAPKTPVQQAAPPVAAPPVPTPPAVVGRSTARGGLPAEPHGPVAGLPAAPTEPPVATPPAPPVEDKVRQMPRLGIEAEYSATLTKQMGRLLEDAKQQIQSAAKNAASEAVAAETGQLLRDLNAQLQQAAQQVIEKVAADAAHQMAERARAEFETLRESGNEVSREKWSAETERLVQQSMQDLNLRLTESGEVVRKQFAEQVEAGAAHAKRQLDEIELRIAALRGVIGNAADAATLRIENMRAEMDATAEAREHHWNERLEQQAVEGIVRLGVLEHEARGLNDRIGAIAGDALKTWHGKLDEELAANDAKWAAAIETAMQTATEKLQQRILDMTSAAELKAETDLSGRMGSLRQALEETTATLRESLTQTTAEAQKRAEELRAEQIKDHERAHTAAKQLEEAAKKYEDFANKLTDAGQTVTNELNRRFESLIAAHSAEMNQRGESLVAEMSDKMKPAFASAAEQSVASILDGVQQQIAPHIEKINETLGRLYAGQALADDHLRSLPDRLNESTEQFVRDATSRMCALLGQMETDFSEANRRTMEKTLAELDEKSTDASHVAFEGLYKAADWYQKKAQTSMQTALEKALDQTAASLREKAAEMSRLFNTELDHYSRSFADHSRGMLEESAREMVDKTRGQLGQAAETTAASFGDEIHKSAQQKMEVFAAESRTTVDGAAAELDAKLQTTQAQMDSKATQAQAKTDAHVGESLTEFQNRVSQRMEQAVTEANQEFHASLLPILDSIRQQRNAQQQEFQDLMARQSNESVESYKERLQNVSNSWMVASVTALNSHSQTLMNSLTQTAEQRLREACSQAFTGLAETLRGRMMGLSAEFLEGFKPKE